MPHSDVLQLTKKAGIPAILADGDTFSVSSRIHDMTVKIKPGDKLKIASAIELIEDYVNIDQLVKDL
jgi:BioD-like phosphotransacetylase family protein